MLLLHRRYKTGVFVVQLFTSHFLMLENAFKRLFKTALPTRIVLFVAVNCYGDCPPLLTGLTHWWNGART